MAGNYSRVKVWVAGEVLSASDLNAEFNNEINNAIPASIDDYSVSVTQMRNTADPGESGSESLATTLAGELDRIRFAIKEIKAAISSAVSYWYQTGKATSGNVPTKDVTNIFTADQKISKSNPIFVFVPASITNNMGLAWRDVADSIYTAGFYFNNNTDLWTLYDEVGAAARVTFERTTGKMTAGIVPLARLENGALPAGVTAAAINIVAGAITNAEISASAAIAQTKLGPQTGTGGEVLRFLRGTMLTGSSPTVVRGTGWSIANIGTGLYRITYSTAFGGAPSTVLGGASQSSGGYIVGEVAQSTTVFDFEVRNLAGARVNDSFALSFITAGP